MYSAKELALILALTVVALLAGAIAGGYGWWLFFAALVWIGLQARQYRRVAQWAENPWSKPRNGEDPWFRLAYNPYRVLLRERQRNRQSAARLRQILDLSELIPDGLIVLGSAGEIEGMNNAAKDVLNIGDADIGIGLSTVVRAPGFVEFLKAAPDKLPGQMEFSPPFNPDQTLEARRFDVEEGGMIVLVRDITALNRLLTVRQSFVANVSHELRTPLAVVKGYLETIADDDEEQDLRLALCARLVEPVRRMENLVDDLMLLTQLESPQAGPQLSLLQLGSVVTSTVRELGGLAGLESRITLDVQGDTRVLGIESELHSVCSNLLNNALRYSPDLQPIHIECREVGGKVRLAVRDQGVGIAPEHLDRLTERFYRVDMADARTRGGTGLGLAIVKHVLRRHGTVLQIESELGVGSTFYCDFEPANVAVAAVSQ